ncbi:MAG: CCA tRNA nucleotidyltransferase [Candidatus Hadarchaeales archaeon]
MESIFNQVLARIKPSVAERRRAEKAAAEIVELVNEKCEELEIKAEAKLVGSLARGTWLKKEKDIDVFIFFPEHLPREDMEKQGMAVARAVAGKAGVERYAEHPYVSMKYRGFDVDLVPCYDVPDPARIKSAVDRTPHHQRYIRERITAPLIDQILLTKAFMRGIGVYGAELKIHGFSGYLCELLTLHHGSFSALVRAAIEWKPATVIDPEKKYADSSEPRQIFEGSPLIVIDPTDRGRNVAASVSAVSFSTFVRACQDFVLSPDERFFFPREVRPMTHSQVMATVRRRGTRLLCLKFRAPDLVPDVLYPQLRKTETAILNKLSQEGYDVVRSDVWANSFVVLLFELSSLKPAGVRTRIGPPLPFPGNEFIREHIGSKERLAGPFIDRAGRLVFEMSREGTAADEISKVIRDRGSLGKNIAKAMTEDLEILDERSMRKLLRDRGFKKFVSEYLTKCLPWYR